MSGIDVELSAITKTYGDYNAVNDFSLSVPSGSFTTLLGPSGCGKTTLLRMIAGFFEPDKGSIIISGKNQKGIPPEKRSTGIVFQDYALFPHMTVYQNLAYGLSVRKISDAVKKDEISRTARILGIMDLLDRYPGELSGGQQQRVALGRVLVLKPQILLMDEPLSNLDSKLRVRVREELKDIQRRLGITTIYVTHDQEEALSLSDYIAVMYKGHLEQTGTPHEIYNFPKTEFAADFTGPANFVEIDGKNHLVRPEWLEPIFDDRAVTPASAGRRHVSGASAGGSADITADTPILDGVVVSEDYFGRGFRVRILLKSGRPIAVDVSDDGARFVPGEHVRFAVKKSHPIG
jgi:ABC-type Fe3+/spermidine/putrescine transport system ATPase subunit